MSYNDSRDALVAHIFETLDDVPTDRALLNATPESLAHGWEFAQSFMYELSHVDCCKPLIENNYSLIVPRGTKQRDETLGLIALSMQHVKFDGRVVVVQANALGAEGLGKTLRKAAGKVIPVTSKHHGRMFELRAGDIPQDILDSWLQAAAPKKIKGVPYMGQAGLFSHERVDAGTQLLISNLPAALHGVAADFGCGPGLLSMALLAYPDIGCVHAIDNDWRAVQLCQQNAADDTRLIPHWGDATTAIPDVKQIDVCVVNPPFHDDGGTTRDLGQNMVAQAWHSLKKGGQIFVVANKNLTYENLLPDSTRLAESGVHKILSAVKN